MGEIIPDYRRNIKEKSYSFISQDEFDKAIDAIIKRYSISPCDPLPYYPKVTEIILKGEVK